MVCSDQQWLSVVDSFSAAAIGAQSWCSALEALASATGSRAGQLTCIDADATVVFNVMANVDPALWQQFADSAHFNPRVQVAQVAPVLKVLVDSDFISPDEADHDPFYQLARRWDLPHICLTTLERRRKRFVALAAVRSQREGAITDQQREVFATIAPHVRSAVRTHLALEGQALDTLLAANESLSIPLFVCDRTRAVRHLTQAAAALVSSDECGLQLKGGQLGALRPAEAKTLNDAIDAAVLGQVRPGPPIVRTVIVHGPGQASRAPVVLDVFAFPSKGRAADLFQFVPRALVVARGTRGSEASHRSLLETAYGLTTAESQIALLLAAGKSAQLIATERGVAVGTVRAQIKSILAKVGVSRQAELSTRLARL